VNSCDAVVIGAGHNGLVAANLLADAGWDVVVLEATGQAGGAVQTAALTAPGFRNDLCAAFFPLGAASPVLQELELSRYGLAWRHAPAVVAQILPDDRCAVLSRDPSRTAASIGGFASADGDTWMAETARFRRIAEPLLEALLRPFPPVRAASRLLRQLSVPGALDLARLAVLPVHRYAIEHYAGAGARMLLAGSALHTDLGPQQAGSAIFGWLLAMLGQTAGFPVPQGGAGALTEALLRRLSAVGGRVEYERPVTRVLHARGVAVGVVDAAGEPVRARRAVLADVPAPMLYGQLVGAAALPAGFRDALDHFQWDNATVKVDWALSAPIPWLAPEAGQAGTVHLDADLDELSRYAAQLTWGQAPERPYVILGQASTADPSRSPAGTESVWAYSHVPQEVARDADVLRGYAERIQQVVERHAPGFGDLVLARHLQLPDDFERHDPSLFGGALNGGTAAVHQQLFLRPVPGLGRADTPIDRLYLASASAHPGGGVHGGPGANAARAALARGGHAGAAYRRMVAAAHRQLYGEGLSNRSPA
jgi:phytoene dehydrogenase-like protein